MAAMRLVLAALLCLAAGAAMAQPDTAGLAFDPHPGAQVPLGTMLAGDDARAMPLREALTPGRPAILVLGYDSCPNLCGVVREDTQAAVAASGLRVPRDVAVLAVSIDPAEQPADAARAKAREGEAVRGWRYLTGDAAPIARAVGFPYRRDDRLAQYLHPSGLVFLTPAGIVSGYLLGVGYPGAALRDAVARAAAGHVARAPSPLLLLCFHFDPATGRYSLDVLRAVQAASLLTAVALGLWLAAAHRRGRRA